MRAQPALQLGHRGLIQTRRNNTGLVLLLQYLLQLAAGPHLAAVENHHLVADILHIGQQMAAQNNRFAARGQQAYHILHLAAAYGVQAAGRLVKNHQVRVIDKRLRQAYAPSHALGKLAHRPIHGVRQAHHVQKLHATLTPLLLAQSEKRAKKVEGLHGGEILVEIGLLGQVADATLHIHVARLFAEDLQHAAVGIKQAKDHLHCGGLARAIRPKQTKNLPLPYIEIDVIDRAGLGPAPEILENLGQTYRFNDYIVSGRHHIICSFTFELF